MHRVRSLLIAAACYTAIAELYLLILFNCPVFACYCRSCKSDRSEMVGV